MLIVEHDRNHCLLLEEELAGEGYRTLTAASAAEAIDRLNERAPDLVVLDLRLPGRHGAEFAEALRATHPGLPIVVHTGDAAYHQSFLPRTTAACVLKNSDLRPLTEAVRRLLAARCAQWSAGSADPEPQAESARSRREASANRPSVAALA